MGSSPLVGVVTVTALKESSVLTVMPDVTTPVPEMTRPGHDTT
jgi:hypothetical protein